MIFLEKLDEINIIIIIGLIAVSILLIIVIYLLNKKNNSIEIEKNKNQDNLEEINIENMIIPQEKEITYPNQEQITINNLTNETKEIKKDFNAEEHVIKYDKELFDLPNIKKNNANFVEKKHESSNINYQHNNMPTRPYERNVLREISTSQTSPIGIIKQKKEIEKTEAADLQEVLNYENVEEQNNIEHRNLENKISNINEEEKKNIVIDNFKDNQVKKENNNNNNENNSNIVINNINENKIKTEQSEKLKSFLQENKFNNRENNQLKEKNVDYIEEVARKLSEAEIPEEINRTDYELKQEEEAIISLKELMDKKDTIEMIDEEEAVISIDELIQKKYEKEKLYNITEKEKNEDFLNELKKFRKDL